MCVCVPAGQMNPDVYIIATVCSVLAVLILCVVGVCVVGGVVLRKKISAAKTSSSYSSQGYKHTLEDGSRNEQKLTYSVSAPPPLDDDGACIDSTIPPESTQANATTPLSSPEQPDSGIQSKHTLEDGSRNEQKLTYSVSAPPPLDDDGTCIIDSTIPPECTQANETTPLSSPEQPDSGIQSVEESIEEEDGIMDTIKAERPTSIVTRRGEPVSLKRKEKESDRVSHLQDEDLFEGGLGGTVASV